MSALFATTNAYRVTESGMRYILFLYVHICKCIHVCVHTWVDACVYAYTHTYRAHICTFEMGCTCRCISISQEFIEVFQYFLFALTPE